jgi:hypothetical protein
LRRASNEIDPENSISFCPSQKALAPSFDLTSMPHMMSDTSNKVALLQYSLRRRKWDELSEG